MTKKEPNPGTVKATLCREVNVNRRYANERSYCILPFKEY